MKRGDKGINFSRNPAGVQLTQYRDSTPSALCEVRPHVHRAFRAGLFKPVCRQGRFNPVRVSYPRSNQSRGLVVLCPRLRWVITKSQRLLAYNCEVRSLGTAGGYYNNTIKLLNMIAIAGDYWTPLKN